MISCRKVREMLTAYALGELELSQHRKVEAHVEGCIGCRQELKAMEQDVLRLSSVLKSEILPPSGLMDGMASMLPAQTKRRSIHWMGWTSACTVACAITMFFWFRPSDPVPLAKLEALNVADLAVPAKLHANTASQVAERLTRETGVAVQPISIAETDQFQGGGCVRFSGKDLPVLVYRIQGTRIAVYEVATDTVQMSGMRPMEVHGRKFFCCSHNGGAVVALSDEGRTYILSGKMQEMELAMTALTIIT